MIVLHSPLPPNECLRRLAAGADGPFTAEEYSVIGGVRGRSFYARRRPPPFVRNSFQPRLTARCEVEAGGTAIRCSFALHPFVVAFLIFWVTGVVLSGGRVGWSHGVMHHYGLSVVPLGMLIFVAVLVGGGWWLTSGDKDFLLSYVQKRTEAQTRT